MAIQFTDQTAKEAIESGKTVVIDFWATWCGPCMKLGPVVEELAEKYGDKAIIGKLNIDENDEIVAEFEIFYIVNLVASLRSFMVVFTESHRSHSPLCSLFDS